MATNTQTPRHKLTIIEDELILELASVITQAGGDGDMAAATYDPQGIADDAFDMANMTEGADAKVMTAAERASIAALGTASTREADQDLRTTDDVEFNSVSLHTAAFDTTNGGPTALGEMAWDSVDGTLDIMADGGVKIAVGEDGMIRVRNVSGTTIAKGAPLVYAGTTGASGKLEVGPWIGANVSNVRTFLGFAAGAMANNTDGYAVWFGKIAEIATDGGAELWDDGDIIYAIPGASATLSNIRPTSGDYVTAAVVINAGSGTSGSIFVRPTFDTVPAASVINFDDLGDAATADLPTINTPLSTALGLKADSSSLATVATSGSYADLTGTPSLATVATSGAYSDLTGTPTLGTAASVDADQNLRTDDDVRFSSIRTSGATIYGLDDGSGNTAYAQFAHTATGDLTISTEQTGTGTAGNAIFDTNLLTVLQNEDFNRINLNTGLKVIGHDDKSNCEFAGGFGQFGSFEFTVNNNSFRQFTFWCGASFPYDLNGSRFQSRFGGDLGSTTFRWGTAYLSNLDASETVKIGTYLFADLPAATTAGLRAFCSDSDTAATGNFASTFAGGGANFVPCYSDGTNWRIG